MDYIKSPAVLTAHHTAHSFSARKEALTMYCKRWALSQNSWIMLHLSKMREGAVGGKLKEL